MAWVAALLAAIVLTAAAMFFYRPAQSSRSIRAVIDPPEKTTFDLTGDSAGPPVLSPDGTYIMFATTGADGKTALWVRLTNSVEVRELPGTDSATFPFWSPDSRSLGFFADGKLKTVDLEGGSTQIICDAPLGRGGAWGSGGVILFSPSPTAPLMRVSANGGTPVPIINLDPALYTSLRWPFFLPDGKHFLYIALHHDASKSANNMLYYASLDGRENRMLFRSQTNAIYAAGFLLFGRGDQLMAQPFDPSSGTVSGEPQNVAKGVMNDSSTWHMDASASNDGLLVFGSGASGDLELVWMDRSGKINTIAGKLPDLQSGVLSPQGDRVALQMNAGQTDIWVLDLTRGVRTRVTFGPVGNVSPIWSPDGKWIAYSSAQSGHFSICRKPSDGSGAEECLLNVEQQPGLHDWSRDGKYLLYSLPVSGGPLRQMFALPLQGERKPALIVERGTAGKLSPDGRWLAYQSAESGRTEIYVMPFGGGQGKWQVSANGSASGGGRPKWSKDGKELYYMDPTYNLFAVPVTNAGGALQFGVAQKLISNWSAPQVFYDVSPDGKKFLLDRVEQQVSQSVTVVTNFTAGLKK
jgi:Tol biopolymer transport system component